MTKRFGALASATTVALLLGLGATAANAGDMLFSPQVPAAAADHGPILGIVPARNTTSMSGGGNGQLVYHNGPVMRTNTTYAIFWEPAGSTVSAKYNSLINRFFTDVAAATTAGATNNVYWANTQYYDTTGSISDQSTFGGSYVDTTAFPKSGCKDRYTSICLSDAQITTEIKNVIAKAGWAAGPNNLFFMFTPKGVGTCYSNSSCSFAQFCAYHSNVSSPAGTIYYANMPYANTVATGCDGGQHPNGDDADATIQVTSHEHVEAITDKAGNAWYDASGYENGDKCAWKFGAMLGSTATGGYNQLINGNPYFLQLEWSNKTSLCVSDGL